MCNTITQQQRTCVIHLLNLPESKSKVASLGGEMFQLLVHGRGKLFRRHVYQPMKYMMLRDNKPAWYAQGLRVAGEYFMMSNGPDREYYNTPPGAANNDQRAFRDYDATNGTISLGNIIRTQKNPSGWGPDPYFNTLP